MACLLEREGIAWPLHPNGLPDMDKEVWKEMCALHPRLEPLLPHIRKPVQYVGGEVNSTVKEWDETDVRWALLYPDAYEVGLPNQGIAILYEVLN